MKTRTQLKAKMRDEYGQLPEEMFESFFSNISDTELARYFGLILLRSGYFAAIR
jgi:hypothetical protein